MLKVIVGAVVVIAAAMIHEIGKYAEEINPYNKEWKDDDEDN